MKEFLEFINNHITKDHIRFRISAHMIKNSEMNATLKIRSFFTKTNYINFDNIGKGESKHNPINLIHDGQAYSTTISLKKPPSKDECRMWIFNLGNHIESNDEVLLLFVNSQLTVIPLNQNLEELIKFLEGVDKNEGPYFDRIAELEKEATFKAIKIDFLKKAKNDQILGLEGELFVVAYEQIFLESLGRKDLSEKVEHKSVTEGDGLGFDILSFDKKGNPKHIEVKTTKGNVYNEFYMSRNELKFLELHPTTYYIYRVFDFNKDEKKGNIKVIYKNIIDQIDLIPVSFKCKLKKM